jgi:hypothetical protein
MGASGTVALPPLPPGVEGVSDYDQLVGDYTNPILQPWAAEVVKKFGEMSLVGITYGNASNQCWPMPMLFVYKQFLVRLLQQPDRVMLIYNSSDVRRVRLNDHHPDHAVLVRRFGRPLRGRDVGGRHRRRQDRPALRDDRSFRHAVYQVVACSSNAIGCANTTT